MDRRPTVCDIVWAVKVLRLDALSVLLSILESDQGGFNGQYRLYRQGSNSVSVLE